MSISVIQFNNFLVEITHWYIELSEPKKCGLQLTGNNNRKQKKKIENYSSENISTKVNYLTLQSSIFLSFILSLSLTPWFAVFFFFSHLETNFFPYKQLATLESLISTPGFCFLFCCLSSSLRQNLPLKSFRQLAPSVSFSPSAVKTLISFEYSSTSNTHWWNSSSLQHMVSFSSLSRDASKLFLEQISLHVSWTK